MLKEIKNLDIKEILNYYKEENKNKIAIPDIYFYIFYKNISKDKYSHNFINSYSNCKNFNKWTKNYYIDENKYLKKRVPIKDSKKDLILI